MILVADAHLKDDDPRAGEFFAMLSAINDDIVFLGDIFDLWVGFPEHEKSVHSTFRTWCQREKCRRSIGFVEGNREFFVAKNRESCFTWVGEKSWRSKNTVFVHGDLVNRRERLYRLLRCMLKNPLMESMAGHRRMGPPFVRFCRRRLSRQKGLPTAWGDADLEEFCDAAAGDGVKLVCSGHFHKYKVYRAMCGVSFYIAPAWSECGQVLRCGPDGESPEVASWQKLV